MPIDEITISEILGSLEPSMEDQDIIFIGIGWFSDELPLVTSFVHTTDKLLRELVPDSELTEILKGSFDVWSGYIGANWMFATFFSTDELGPGDDE